MKKLGLIAAGAAVFLLSTAGSALADPPAPQDPCAHNPTTLCDGTVRVVVEDPGENCPAGGLKVTIQRGKLDGSEDPPTLFEANGPPEDPPDEVFFVCNGVAGPAGPPGPPGPPGPSTGGPTTIVTQPVAPRCGPSLRLGVRLYLPARLRGFSALTLRVDRKPPRLARVRQDVRGRRLILVPMRGRHCGPHTISVGRRGVRPLVQVWTVGGHLKITRQVLAR